MKRLITVLLVLAMCLSLCACGKSEEVLKAEELINAIGEVSLESEEAITAAEEALFFLEEKEIKKISNLDTLGAARETFDQLCAERDQKMLDVIAGKWVSNSSYIPSITITEDKKMRFEGESNEAYISIFDGYFSMDPTGKLGHYTPAEKDGITYIVSDDMHAIYFREEDAKTVEHEITADNWQDYFTLETAVEIQKNGFDEPEYVNEFHYLSLKEEYRPYLANANYDDKDHGISVEVNRKTHTYGIELDVENNSYTLGKQMAYSSWEETAVADITQNILWTFCFDEEYAHYYGVSIYYNYAYYSDWEKEWQMSYADSFDILRLKGKMMFYEKPLNDIGVYTPEAAPAVG